MTITAGKTKKIVLVVVFGLLFFSSANASEIANSVNEYDSMYRYSALENKISFIDTTNNENDSVKKVPESNEPLGDAVKNLQDITEKQDSSIKRTESVMNTSKNRSGLTTFLVGNNLGILRFQLVQIEDQTSVLQALALKTEYSPYLLQIDNQFRVLKEEQKKVEDLILKKKDEFSLFGWLVKMI